MAINLHGVVRGVINSIHEDETVHWYRFAGQVNVDGALFPSFFAPVTVKAQVQSESDEALAHSNNVGESAVVRRFYMYADGVMLRPAGLVRPLERGGDLLFRLVDSTWWLITATKEDFSESGWVCVRAVQQIKPDGFTPEVTP